jgi:hypothetical protein
LFHNCFCPFVNLICWFAFFLGHSHISHHPFQSFCADIVLPEKNKKTRPYTKVIRARRQKGIVSLWSAAQLQHVPGNPVTIH